jgi:glycosyltransferase involved in cell wall biosynthesis
MNTRDVKVLHFSSHDEDCGVGKYQENYLVGMNNVPGVYNKFFEISPYQTRAMDANELQKAMEQLAAELADFDILHIQHEFGLYWFDQFKQIVETGKRAGKKVVVTVHLSPDFAIKPARRGGLGPRSALAYLQARKHYHRMVDEHIVPLRSADMVIVHNQVTAKSLERFGVSTDKIVQLEHPVYKVPEPPKSTLIREKLNKQDGDIIFCITGFLHRYKGIVAAIRALKFLPSHYKLALLGGVKADSDEVTFEDAITDLIDQLGLHDRVYIAGFVPDDDVLNALIRECDVCIYPYDRVYYANLSSGSLSLAFANSQPVIAYPTQTLKELADFSDGAVVLTETFAYYEIARELQRLDMPKQRELSRAFAQKNAWPKAAKKLVAIYQQVVED